MVDLGCEGIAKLNPSMNIDLNFLLTLLAVGAVAGFLAGVVMRGGGLGLIGNIVVGLLGAVLAGWLFRNFNVNLGMARGIPQLIVQGFIGAVILLFVLGLVKR